MAADRAIKSGLAPMHPGELLREEILPALKAKGIPRTDAKWMGDLLGQLSHDQLKDAFRAADYSPEEVEGFTSVLEQRIAPRR